MARTNPKYARLSRRSSEGSDSVPANQSAFAASLAGLRWGKKMELLASPNDGRVQTGDPKALGAYYTDVQIADFLAWWALRSGSDTVLDPCFGGGVFLRAACKRLAQLRGNPQNQVLGVEIDANVHRQTTGEVSSQYCVNRGNLIRADFFSIDVTKATTVDAVIGNPPFVRYQRFSGDARKIALDRSVAHGVRLPELCSSWAPFLVHCIAMLRSGGRLAMVLPMEIGHAKYARPVLDYLRRSFKTTTFLTFRQKLFPDLNQDTVLLVAEGKGGSPSRFLLRDFAHSGLLLGIRESEQRPIAGTRRLDSETISSAEARLVEYLIPAKARALYRELELSAQAQRLGSLTDVGIGYVTGANDFFHLDPQEARRWGISREFLKPAVRRGRALSGLRFTTQDWQSATDAGDAGFLLHIPKNKRLPSGIEKYLEFGASQGTDKAYKCRTRSPWFCVPHVHRPDAFLTYMSGATPRLVANRAEAYAPNSLLVLRLHPLSKTPGDALAALWQTSLTRLSVEIEGHPLGGGMLKLEPTEARNVLLPDPRELQVPRLLQLADELHEMIRVHGGDAADARADEVILRDMMGLSRSDCNLLRSAASRLRCRRGYRETANGAA